MIVHVQQSPYINVFKALSNFMQLLIKQDVTNIQLDLFNNCKRFDKALKTLIRACLALLSLLHQAVEGFPPFFLVPLLLSKVIIDVMFILEGPFSQNNFKYFAVTPSFSATAIAYAQILDAFQHGQSVQVTFPFSYINIVSQPFQLCSLKQLVEQI